MRACRLSLSGAESHLRRKIKELGLRSVDEVVSALKAGMCACQYAPGVQDVLNEVWGGGGGATAVRRRRGRWGRGGGGERSAFQVIGRLSG